VAKERAKRVLHDFSSVQKTEVSIRKMKPPVDHDLQFVSTTITLDRTQN
jgi:dihydroneopterin aldolase